jgi:dienelactone hydrolase
MSSTREKSLVYAVGEKQYIGLFLTAADRRTQAMVVLLSDWRGQSGLARDHAGYLVQLGYDVVIADLYGDGFTPTDPAQVGPLVKRLLENRGEGVKALQGCIEEIKTQLGFSGPIFCLGYSAGGMVALDYGRTGATLAGIIVCSGLLKTAAPGMPAGIKAPVLFLQGTQDEVSTMDVVNAVIKEMDEAGNNFRFELFGQTHHAFDNPEAGTDPTARLVYSPRSAARARLAIAEFLGAANKSSV